MEWLSNLFLSNCNIKILEYELKKLHWNELECLITQSHDAVKSTSKSNIILYCGYNKYMYRLTLYSTKSMAIEKLTQSTCLV